MEGTIGEIRLFAGNFAPKSWALCQGQLINIASNTALFSILGTTYGGNGTTTFGLPNYQGRDVLSQGTGPGLSTYVLGQAGGVETNTVLPTNMPVHAHPTLGSGGDAPTQNTASGASLATGGRSDMPNIYSAGNANPTPMGSMTGIAGSGQPMPNMQPYLVLNYIICLFGVFPARN